MSFRTILSTETSTEMSRIDKQFNGLIRLFKWGDRTHIP